jgi:hypothetical protein
MQGLIVTAASILGTFLGVVLGLVALRVLMTILGRVLGNRHRGASRTVPTAHRLHPLPFPPSKP